jgi:hypothetical protein
MKRICILLAAGLLLLGSSAVRAGEDEGVPGTLNLAPMPQASRAPCCAAPACGGACKSHCDRCLDWLMYKPPHAHCACRHVVSPCVPPLYLWFLDMCPAGGCGNGCGTHASQAAPCNGGGCRVSSH